MQYTVGRRRHGLACGRVRSDPPSSGSAISSWALICHAWAWIAIVLTNRISRTLFSHLAPLSLSIFLDRFASKRVDVFIPAPAAISCLACDDSGLERRRLRHSCLASPQPAFWLRHPLPFTIEAQQPSSLPLLERRSDWRAGILSFPPAAPPSIITFSPSTPLEEPAAQAGEWKIGCDRDTPRATTLAAPAETSVFSCTQPAPRQVSPRASLHPGRWHGLSVIVRGVNNGMLEKMQTDWGVERADFIFKAEMDDELE